MDGINTKVEVVSNDTPEIVEAFARLLPQLSRSAPPLTLEPLDRIVSSPSNTVFIARSGSSGQIVGTLTLVLMRIPTGLRAWIEDVVVDQMTRGTGAGRALVQAALDHAGRVQARTVDLTSNPTRIAAHKLYEKAGFSIRETRVYRYQP
ncbi:GNAT family N-acetyltransferase [Bordetella genomosp. 11]|uniref:GNAT family N-acetyltransferase n=1 Tax=Bordetella genomosp. 11 TaxID=1416808 RepID=A0A261UYD3_9BORD|nr:GNAT family N-acetyltransferase [Bordetella genomosp. 11]OZI66889.1 GNAT family N-acetyltransferase [Bordetella genomosp. 11]